ncbi:MAG: hypothetical protein JWM34_1083 [Ilumatobacteraceae bacterium]|nr:hypothetical protein [Ilumatobacteraceae bacterium]
MPASGSEAAGSSSESIATFHGRKIDLSVSWEGAGACWIRNAGSVCYDTTAEMIAAMAPTVSAARSGPVPNLACSSSVVLYKNASHGGASAGFTDRLTFIGLSGIGFANVVSSYTVGACSAAFQDSAGLTYPGTTTAGASANSMVSGWDNRLYSIYIS